MPSFEKISEIIGQMEDKELDRQERIVNRNRKVNAIRQTADDKHLRDLKTKHKEIRPKRIW